MGGRSRVEKETREGVRDRAGQRRGRSEKG